MAIPCFHGTIRRFSERGIKRRKQALAEQENNSASNLDRVDGKVLCDVDDKSYNDTVCDNAVNADEATDIDDKTNKKERNAEKQETR